MDQSNLETGMGLCYVCNTWVHKFSHECAQAAKLAANPVIFDAPFLTAAAVPTIKGPFK